MKALMFSKSRSRAKEYNSPEHGYASDVFECIDDVVRTRGNGHTEIIQPGADTAAVLRGF